MFLPLGVNIIIIVKLLQSKKHFFIPLVHWMSNVQILVVQKFNSLVQKRVKVNNKMLKNVEIV